MLLCFVLTGSSVKLTRLASNLKCLVRYWSSYSMIHEDFVSSHSDIYFSALLFARYSKQSRLWSLLRPESTGTTMNFKHLCCFIWANSWRHFSYANVPFIFNDLAKNPRSTHFLYIFPYTPTHQTDVPGQISPSFLPAYSLLNYLGNYV